MNIPNRFSKNTQIKNFRKIHSVGDELFMRTDGLTDMTKLTAAYQNFANAPKDKYKPLGKNPIKPNPEGAYHQAMQFKVFLSVTAAVTKYSSATYYIKR
jgi:hypothetical protein